MFLLGGRPMTSRLKYSRNALYINVLPIARYFRQRFAPFIRHRRRSQGYLYRQTTTFIYKKRSGRQMLAFCKPSSRHSFYIFNFPLSILKAPLGHFYFRFYKTDFTNGERRLAVQFTRLSP